jgi:hypothetical protein
MYNLSEIMQRAWEMRRKIGYTFQTALKLAWAEAKGKKVYTFHLEGARASISSYLVKLAKIIRGKSVDIHQIHKFEILREALLCGCDRQGMAVMDGKMVGLCKYAVRNA